MIHQPLGGAQGQAADIEIQANEIMVIYHNFADIFEIQLKSCKHHKSTLNGYLAEFTKKPLQQVETPARAHPH